MPIKITSDSTCDLSPELLERYHISLLPLYISLDGVAHKDGVDITPDDIFAHVASGGGLPTTAAVNIADYQSAFSPLSVLYSAVIHICISADFSSCYQNACIAAEEFDNVYVVDSRNLSSGHGLVVIEAALAAQRGDSPEHIVAYLKELTDRVEASFIPDRLDYLVKGGRCSAAAALGANLLKLKPCIQVTDGKMNVAKKYRGTFPKVLLNYVQQQLSGRDDLSLDRIFITYTPCPDSMIEAVRAEVAKYGFSEILESPAGCTISSHCGPGTLGIFFIRNR